MAHRPVPVSFAAVPLGLGQRPQRRRHIGASEPFVISGGPQKTGDLDGFGIAIGIASCFAIPEPLHGATPCRDTRVPPSKGRARVGRAGATGQ